MGDLFVIDVSWSYELATHARITQHAMEQSRIVQVPTLLVNLGFAEGAATVLGESYYDVTASTVQSRHTWPFDFDRDKMPGVSDDAKLPLRIAGWLMRGAVREDDSGLFAGVVVPSFSFEETEPHDDPYNNFNRFCNHFFDPLHDRPLTAYCFNEHVEEAPVWAIGAVNPFMEPALITADPTRRNHFTVYDAREAMWRALTLTQKNMNGTYSPIGVNDDAATREHTRQAYWATMFRSLGDVLHLNQDMAQPQHTRDESHGTSHAALYEKYIDARARRATLFKIDGVTLTSDQLPDLTYAGYGTPRFGRYSDYWSSGIGDPQTFTGKGLADYSSRGFFTPANNFGDGKYPRPPSDTGAYTAVLISDADGFREEYLDGTVIDTALGQNSPNIHMTRRSIWDDSLDVNGVAPVYSLDRATFDDRAVQLLPRAAAYSAGLLDYFFRGQVEISLPDEGVYAIADYRSETEGFRKLKVKLKNTTLDITPPGGTAVAQGMTGGRVVVVVKFHRNLCHSVDLSNELGGSGSPNACRSPTEEIVTSLPTDVSTIPADVPQLLVFDFSAHPIPFAAADVLLQVVYRGTLGAEDDAVVVATKDISEPSFFALANYTDYVYDIDDGTYHRLPYNALHVHADLVSDIRLSFATSSGPVLASVASLDGGQHAELAWLSEPGFRPFALSTASAFGDFPGQYVYDDATWFDESINLFRHLPCPFYQSRGVYRDFLAFFYESTQGGRSWTILRKTPAHGESAMAALSQTPVEAKAGSAHKDAPTSLPACADGTGIMNHSAMMPLGIASVWQINF